MSDDIARLRAAGFRFYGVSGREFVLPNGDIVGVEQAPELLDPARDC